MARQGRFERHPHDGPGGVPARFIYKRAGLGRPWFYSFFNALNVPLATDQRQLVDWLAQGRYAIAAFVDTDVAQTAIDQGLPIAPVSISSLKEGGAVAPGAGSISAMNHAPHPNAAKLYINWLCRAKDRRRGKKRRKRRRCGSISRSRGCSCRRRSKRGVTYANGGAEAYSVLTGTVFARLIKDRT